MECLLAKSDRQLGIGMRMLHDEGYNKLVIESVINAKNRMEFHIYVDTDADTMERLNARYQTLIS
jgi:hypothetical protein